MRLIDANKLMLWLNDVWYSSFKYEESPTSIAVKEAMKAIVEYVNTQTDVEPSGDLISREEVLRAIKDHAGDAMPSIILPDLDMTMLRALKVIMGYCNKHGRCGDGCKLYQEEYCALMRNYSPCDWGPIIKAVKEQEDEDE